MASYNGLLSFEAARIFVRKQCLGNTQHEWREYSDSGERPSNIPANPHIVYRDAGWVSWFDWLDVIDPPHWGTEESEWL